MESTEICTVSLHDALPISHRGDGVEDDGERVADLVGHDGRELAEGREPLALNELRLGVGELGVAALQVVVEARSEEHTSELQSRLHIVCRRLLEKKNQAR